MKHSTIRLALIGVFFVSSSALAQSKPPAMVDFGALEYKSSCATCHGLNAKGDGPLRPYLVKAPSDLTTLAKRNGGVFPVQRTTEVIDGRTQTEIAGHGSREMPAWGARYSAEAPYYYLGGALPGPYETDAFVRTRIAALIDYLNRMQGK